MEPSGLPPLHGPLLQDACIFSNVFFAILHGCEENHNTNRPITLWSKKLVSLYFIKYSLYQKMFQIKIVDLAYIYILRHVYVFVFFAQN